MATQTLMEQLKIIPPAFKILPATRETRPRDLTDDLIKLGLLIADFFICVHHNDPLLLLTSLEAALTKAKIASPGGHQSQVVIEENLNVVQCLLSLRRSLCREEYKSMRRSCYSIISTTNSAAPVSGHTGIQLESRFSASHGPLCGHHHRVVEQWIQRAASEECGRTLELTHICEEG